MARWACGFQSIPITHSIPFRSLIPVHSDHPWLEWAAVLENPMVATPSSLLAGGSLNEEEEGAVRRLRGADVRGRGPEDGRSARPPGFNARPLPAVAGKPQTTSAVVAAGVDSPRARTTASGSRSITVSSTRAARSGTRRPCSQSWTARTSSPNRSANFWRLSFMRLRRATMCFAAGLSTIRIGSTASPRTWASTSARAASSSRPRSVRVVIGPLPPSPVPRITGAALGAAMIAALHGGSVPF